jgi:hypothetical protein
VEPGKNTVKGLVLPAFPSQEEGRPVAAYGVAEVPLAAVAGLRRSLGPPGQPPFPATFLKAAEDQTVVALAAVARAVEAGGLQQESLASWGVIAAPRSLGRLAAAEALHKFEQGGASKVSPFLVPHHSLHSMSGTISQGFRTYGPNFGVGGHSRAVVEGLLAALALLHEASATGLLLVLSECDPEPVPGREGASLAPILYRVLALAFRGSASDSARLRLRLIHGRQAGGAAPAPTVADVVQFLERDKGSAAVWSCPVPWGATLELTRAAAQAVSPLPFRHVA